MARLSGISRVLFVAALLLPINWPAFGDYDSGCAGVPLTPEAQEWLQFLNNDVYVAFNDPFQGCDEGSLFLDAEPDGTYGQLIQGERMLADHSEYFCLEVLSYSDGLWDGLQDINASGYVQAWLHGPTTSVAINGAVIQVIDSEGAPVTAVLPLSLMSSEDFAAIGIIMNGDIVLPLPPLPGRGNGSFPEAPGGAQQARPTDEATPAATGPNCGGQTQTCYGDCHDCVVTECRVAINNANSTRNTCLASRLGGTVLGTGGCIKAFGKSRWGIVPCIVGGVGAGGLVVTVCQANYNNDVANACAVALSKERRCQHLPACQPVLPAPVR